MWLAAQRTAKGLTQKDVFDALREGWPDLFPWRSATSLDSYRAFEKGLAEPSAEQEAAFLDYFKAEPPPVGSAGPESTPGSTDPALLKALKDQTEAITKLADQVTRLVERPSDAELPGEIAAAVALAVRDTLRAVGIGDGLPRP